MENLNLGTFVFPETATTGTASYSVPGLISKKQVNQLLKTYSTGHHKQKVEESDSDDDEVTHTVFFGENIKRVLKAFK